MTHLTTPELIRALGGADAICREGCTCRGSYAGPERRAKHRYANAEIQDAALHPCRAEGCERSGPHDLHRDSEGFEWRQQP